MFLHNITQYRILGDNFSTYCCSSVLRNLCGHFCYGLIGLEQSICCTAKASSSASLATPSLSTEQAGHCFPEEGGRFSSWLASLTLQHFKLLYCHDMSEEMS